jgi:hypothetical protein
VIVVCGRPVIVVATLPLSAIYRIGVLPFASSAPRAPASDVVPVRRADCSAGTELGAVVESEAATEPLPATVTVAVSPLAAAETTAPDDEIVATDDELAAADGTG